MSTISSNADINTKYQRVAAEYAKLKGQVATLKNAVINEQSTNQALKDQLHISETNLRKLNSEKDGLEFRNAQLLKRVEALQADMETARRSSKKKSVFQKNAKKNEHSTNDYDVFSSELQKKIKENEILQEKLSSMESEQNDTIRKLDEKCMQLHEENDALRKHTAPTDHLIKISSSYRIKRERGDSSSVEKDEMDSQKKVATTGIGEEALKVLWLDAIRMTRTLASGFANLLQLFEQRSTIYPSNINMEKLSEQTLLYGRQLLSSCDLFEACASGIEGILVKSSEDECIQLNDECVKFVPKIADALRSCQVWKELFSEGNKSESRLTWCGLSLSRCNTSWNLALLDFIDSLAALATLIENTTSEQFFKQLLSHIQRISSFALECNRAYNAKISIEDHIPTASKRLRCVNECIEKCFSSLQRNLNSFYALLQLIVSSSSTRNEISETRVDLPLKDSEKELIPSQGLSAIKEELAECAREGLSSLSEENVDLDQSSAKSISILKEELAACKEAVLALKKEKEQLFMEKELLRNPTMLSDSTVLSRSDETRSICEIYQQKIGDLYTDIEHIKSRALYYKCECQELLKIAEVMKNENLSLAGQLEGVSTELKSAKEDLETTRGNYEKQLQDLHEYIAEMTVKLEDHSKSLNSMRDVFNGVPTKPGLRRTLFK